MGAKNITAKVVNKRLHKTANTMMDETARRSISKYIIIIIIIINIKLYNITTLVAKCRIDSFRLTGTGSICHMFLLNVELSYTCRFRVFQCHFSTVSRFHSRVFSHPSVDTDEQSTGSGPHLYQTFKML